MPLTLPAIAIGAAAVAGGIVRGAQVGALDEGPEYIRDGDPASPLDAVGLFAARQACKIYANDPGALNDRPAAAYERVCRPFLDNIGYGSGPGVNLPFRGGQCPGVQYRIEFSWTTDQGTRQSLEQIVGAPLVGTYSEPGNFGATRVGYVLRNNDGSTTRFLQATVQDPNTRPNPSVRVVRREDNLPDNCGNPPPDFTDPVPPDEPETGPRPFVFAPNFNFDVDVELDVDGRISIDIGTGPVVVDPFGEEDDGGEGPGGGGEDAPGSPEPGPELPGGNGGFGGDDAFGAPPAGKRWVGACIRIVAVPQGAGVIPQSVPDDVYPTVVGNVRLVGAPGGSRLTDTPIQVRAKHVCVWEPVRGFNPTGLSVDLLPGYGYTYRPYAVPEDN